MSKELDAIEVFDRNSVYTTPYSTERVQLVEAREILENAIECKEKLEKVVELLKNKDIEMNLLKATFKFETELGYSYYLKIWCMNSLMTFDDTKFITKEEYHLLKEVLK